VNSRTYENIQGIGSWVAFLATGVAFPFSLEYAGLIDAMSADLYTEGRAMMFLIIVVSISILAVTLAVKAGLSWAEYKWYYRQDLAQKLHRLADRIAKR
jgi:uncharacterized membrane protein